MESSLQRSSASFAWAMNCSRSMPASAAGRRPKIDSAEKRPPTVGSPLKTASQPSSCAWRSSCEPGSVMATRWFAKLISGACASRASRSAEESRRGRWCRRLRGHDNERRRWIAVGEQLAHAHGRIGIERLERDAVCPNRVGLVVFRDSHGRLRGSALADEDDGLDAARHHIVGKALNFREVALRAHAQIDPAHKVLGGLARTVGEIIKRCVLGQHAAGDAFLHKRFRRRV